MKLLKCVVFLILTVNFFASAYLKYFLGGELTDIQNANIVLYPILIVLVIFNWLADRCTNDS